MSREYFKAWGFIKNQMQHFTFSDLIEEMVKNSMIVEEALQRLLRIDDTKSNEALEAFNRIQLHCEYDNNGSYDCVDLEDDCEIIEQYIHKSQQHNKVLSIIKEKMVNLLLLELAENIKEYNKRIVPNGRLTEEEFIILKRWQNE